MLQLRHMDGGPGNGAVLLVGEACGAVCAGCKPHSTKQPTMTPSTPPAGPTCLKSSCLRMLILALHARQVGPPLQAEATMPQCLLPRAQGVSPKMPATPPPCGHPRLQPDAHLSVLSATTMIACVAW